MREGLWWRVVVLICRPPFRHNADVSARPPSGRRGNPIMWDVVPHAHFLLQFLLCAPRQILVCAVLGDTCALGDHQRIEDLLPQVSGHGQDGIRQLIPSVKLHQSMVQHLDCVADRSRLAATDRCCSVRGGNGVSKEVDGYRGACGGRRYLGKHVFAGQDR